MIQRLMILRMNKNDNDDTEDDHTLDGTGKGKSEKKSENLEVQKSSDDEESTTVETKSVLSFEGLSLILIGLVVVVALTLLYIKCSSSSGDENSDEFRKVRQYEMKARGENRTDFNDSAIIEFPDDENEETGHSPSYLNKNSKKLKTETLKTEDALQLERSTISFDDEEDHEPAKVLRKPKE